MLDGKNRTSDLLSTPRRRHREADVNSDLQMLGLRLRQARMRCGLAQRQAADALGVSYQQIQKFEAGADRISAQALFKLAHLFDVGVAFFADETVRDANTIERILLARMTAVFDSLKDVADRELVLALATRLASAGSARDEEPAPVRAAAAPVAGAKRVLLVDDDADSLRVTAAMIRRAGFDVVVAPSGDVALTLLADETARFDALVTDHAMPGLSGLELVKIVLDSHPSLPALVVTGYGRDADLGELPPEVGVLSKPFSRADLVGRVSVMTRTAQEDARPSRSNQ